MRNAPGETLALKYQRFTSALASFRRVRMFPFTLKPSESILARAAFTVVCVVTNPVFDPSDHWRRPS